MQTICTSLHTDNHTNTPSLNVYRPNALPATQPTVSKHTNTRTHRQTHTHRHTQRDRQTDRHTDTHSRSTALIRGYPGELIPQKGKTNLDFTEARDIEWKWNPLGHMQLCTSLQTNNHASTPPVFYRPNALPAAQPTVSKH